MSNPLPTKPATEIRVCLDMGCYQHHVSVGLSNGVFLTDFVIDHEKSGFNHFFSCLKHYEDHYNLPVEIAMEGYNGHARPLDQLIKQSPYRLFNLNSLKLKRYKEIFPSPSKTDAIDSRKGLELFQLRDHLPLARDVFQEVAAIPKYHHQLKRLIRRRDQLLNEKIRCMGRLQSDLQAVSPGLLSITGSLDNLWFLRLLTSVKHLSKLSRLRVNTLLKIQGIGAVYLQRIRSWQQEAQWSEEVDWVSSMIIDDANHTLQLIDKIKSLEAQIADCNQQSPMAMVIDSIPGFGVISSGVLAGEIGTIERFEKESSLAMYMGMATLNNESGVFKGSKVPRQINRRIKAAMMIAVDRHRHQVVESQRYYEKKRAEGKSHNQAIRSLGRHLVRVLYKLMKENREYIIHDENE